MDAVGSSEGVGSESGALGSGLHPHKSATISVTAKAICVVFLNALSPLGFVFAHIDYLFFLPGSFFAQQELYSFDY
ncbi:MAG: hypothetical protein ACOX88_08715 [Christensenellales bacterium]